MKRTTGAVEMADWMAWRVWSDRRRRKVVEAEGECMIMRGRAVGGELRDRRS